MSRKLIEDILKINTVLSLMLRELLKITDLLTRVLYPIDIS